MNTRQWLSRYQELMEEVEREAKKAGYWRDKAEGLSTKALSHAPVYGHSISMPDYVAEFLDLAKHCSELAENAETAKDEILEVIDSIENHTYRRILRMKYLDGKTFYEIGSDIGYNASYTRRLASQAIKEVTQSNIYLSYNGIQKN